MDTTPQAPQNLGNTIPPSNQQPVESDEIDLKDLFVQIWAKRKQILIITSVSFIVGLFFAITSPVQYTASCTILPQISDRNSGNLGGLASILGVNMSNASGQILSPSIYPKIIQSVPFCLEIMQTPITLQNFPNQISLDDFYTNKKYQKKNILNILKKYTIGLPSTILSMMQNKNNSIAKPVILKDSTSNKILSLSKNEQKVIDNIRNGIQFESNLKEGYITLGYSFSEPMAAAEITQNICTVLEKYVVSYKAQKAQDNLNFVQSSYEEARADFLRKQSELAAFQDANRDLSTASARAILRRLNSEYDIAFTVYNELAKQLEQAKLAVKQSTPVLTVIDPVVVPNQKSAPRRAMILIVFTFLGFIIGVGWVFVKPFVDDLRYSVQTAQHPQSEQSILNKQNE